MGPAPLSTKIFEVPQMFFCSSRCNNHNQPQYHISAKSLITENSMIINKILVNLWKKKCKVFKLTTVWFCVTLCTVCWLIGWSIVRNLLFSCNFYIRRNTVHPFSVFVYLDHGQRMLALPVFHNLTLRIKCIHNKKKKSSWTCSAFLITTQQPKVTLSPWLRLPSALENQSSQKWSCHRFKASAIL